MGACGGPKAFLRRVKFFVTGCFSVILFVIVISHKKNREKTSVINNFSKSSEKMQYGHF